MAERTPETNVIDFRAAEQLLAARDPRGAVKLLDAVIAVHPENTAARLLRARAFFLAAQLRPAELEFQIVLEREPDNAFAHFALARTLERAGRAGGGPPPLPAGGGARPAARVPGRRALRRPGPGLTGPGAAGSGGLRTAVRAVRPPARAAAV